MLRPVIGLVVLLAASSARAEVGDPTVQTDHPHYAGEGAFQSIEDCVRFATAGLDDEATTQDRAIALYQWLLMHQYHLMSPQEWCIPGRVPDTAEAGDYELVPFDADRARFSYGYGLCGTVHAWNEPYWRALGTRPRRRAFPGHVNSEIEYGGSWHAFDTDMAGLLFRRDGVVAGYDDVVRDPSLVDSLKPPLPHYPYAWPGDFDTMKRGWQEVARTTQAGENWYAMYNSGYAAHPGIVHLRTGETFTRWFDRDHFGGPEGRRFWHNHEGGPQRNWTFVNARDTFHDGAQSHGRNDASYSNAEFVYEPPLTADAWREGTADASPNVAGRATSPRLHAADGQHASVTFQHFSPYVICGDPADDANPMSGPATGGLVLEGRLVGNVAIAFSNDHGQSWHDVPFESNGEGRFSIDLTDLAKGRYGWQLRFLWQGDAGLDELRFATVCQMAQTMYPRLTPDGCDVTYRSASRGVVPVLPNLGLPETSLETIEVRPLRSSNVAYAPRSPDNRLAWQTTDNKPGQIVFRVAAPGELLEVRAAIRYQLRVPPPEGADYRLEVSTDEGRTWREFAASDIPTDNEFSSGWLAGTANVAEAGVREALVRATFFAGGHRTGLIDAQLYGVHRTRPPRPLRIEYGWIENGTRRTHAVDVPAATNRTTFTVPTTAAVQDDFVRLTVPAP